MMATLCLVSGDSSRNGHARLGGAADPGEDGTECTRIAADLVHQLNSVQIRSAFDLARIGRLQYGARTDDHRSATDEIAQQHAEQEREAGRVEDRPRAVPMRDVTNLVCDHPGKLVSRF